MVDAFAPLWGGAYALWAFGKVGMGSVPMACQNLAPLAGYDVMAAMLEFFIGIAVLAKDSRHVASLIGFATCLGLVLFAFIAADRGLPWKGCGCIWIGVETPWVPGHVLFALALAVPFALIFLHEERRVRAGKRAEIDGEGERE